MDAPGDAFAGQRFDIVYCYGLLYHLERPAEAIRFLAERCGRLLLLSTCVSYGDEVALNPVPEPADSPTQALHGLGCRPSRTWVLGELQAALRYGYVTATQPWHPEFPLDWTTPPAGAGLTRAVFVGSREAIESDLLLDSLSPTQRRH